MCSEASFSPRFSASHDGAAAVRPGFPSGGAATLFSDASAPAAVTAIRTAKRYESFAAH